MPRLLALPLLLALLSGPVSAGEWQNLIGDSLDDWTKVGGGATYELKDGVITGTTGPGSNTFLTKGPYADFELIFDVKCDAALNSGVQVRSHTYEEDTPQASNPKRKRKKGETYGYQCEIRGEANGPNGCSGNFWDEGRRTKWLDTTVDAEEKQKAYKPGEWNTYRIVAKGNRIQSFVNDVPVADFTDDLDASGFIGLQVHSIPANKGPYKVSWKNIKLRKLDK